MSLSTEAIEKGASACYEDVIMELNSSPPAETLPKILIGAQKRCSEVCLALKIVGDAAVGKTLSSIAETADIPIYGTIKEAIEATD